MTDDTSNPTPETPHPSKGDSEPKKRASKDITPVLKGWDYEPGTINVRKVSGLDGHTKLQMRLDLGILQMEMTGRPDGVRPHGHESLLEYFESLLDDHKKEHGTELGFHLTSDQCQSLSEEAVMYYHRYLSLFVLEEYPAVIRDTERNLRVIDLCGKYADDEQDRLVLEQYRPYILMMRTRARAQVHLKTKRYDKGLETVHEGLIEIREFFARFGQEEAFNRANEVKVLKRFAKEIRKKIPVDPLTKLQNQLDRAVKAERYEEAARLRDEMASRQQQPRES